MIRRDPRSVNAVVELAEWIALDSPAAADRFIDAVEETYRRLHDAPGLGRPYPDPPLQLAGLRIHSVFGFPNHLVFYRPVAQDIEIVLVVHGARDIGRALES
jgi:toxin ParE1/3/4